MPESLARPVARREAAVTSYEEYVTLRWPTLYRTAYLMTGSHADAEDLVQSALVKVYGAWDKVSRPTRPTPTCAGCWSTPSSAAAARCGSPASGSSPRSRSVPHVSQGPEDRLSIWPHVAALPPKQRAVIVLRYYEDLSEQQIADALGCSPGTVKSNASLAIRSLRSRMEGARS